MVYRDVVVGLTAALERELLGLWRRLPEDEFIIAGAAAIARANARVTTAADLAVAAAIAQELAEPPEPVGLTPEEQHVDQERLRSSLRDVLDEKIKEAAQEKSQEKAQQILFESRSARIARIANDEVPGTASRAMTRAMAERAEVVGWRRNLGRSPCQLCRRWAGEILPAYAQMARHATCKCTQEPVIRRR